MIKKLVTFLFSMFFSVLLLMMFAIAIAYATFIENDYGTSTAQVLIYQSWWFELLLFVGIVNLSGSVVRYKLINRQKWAILMFHLAFILILLGAGITRYFGFEGSMHIREGESTNRVVSETTFITLQAKSNNQEVKKLTKVRFTPNTNNRYRETLQIDGKEITIENELFVAGASEMIVHDQNGVPIISLLYSSHNGQSKEFILKENEIFRIPEMVFGFGTGDGTANVVFIRSGNGVSMSCTDTISMLSMNGQTVEKFAPSTAIPVMQKSLYTLNDVQFIMKNYHPMGNPVLVQSPDERGMGGKDAFTAILTSGNEIKRLNVFENNDEFQTPTIGRINGIEVSLSYGAVTRELPFSIQLRDFQLERYPGSNSPSSYASEITLNDPSAGIERPFRIFMNNILKYKGYRFFQSSFDQDEKGTILSVNQDYWGTLISYLGYFFMALGMVIALFSRGSRFQKLIRLSAKLQQTRKLGKAFLVFLILGLSGSAFQTIQAAESAKEQHIQSLGKLLVQDHQGRIEPLNTLASDILRKISGKDNWEGMDPVEFFVDMSANPEKWKNIPIVKISNNELRKNLGFNGKAGSFGQFFDQSGNYRLNELVQQSYNKKQTQRNKYDKEIINVDERVNICYQIFKGDFLKIFPVPNDEQKTWVTQANLPTTMKKEEANFAGNILGLYYEAYLNGQSSGNWSKANEYLAYIVKFQSTYGADIIPSSTKISLEIIYNQLNIFGKLAKIYALLGFILLVIHFIVLFKQNASMSMYIKAFNWLIFLAFLLYTSGLIVRWYISGHAPWSNGYETMIYIGWATSLSGFLFLKRSPISLAVTAILAGIILFVAGMSWMNPEITNLVPVLKSYWLIVHVAIITASYGFLAMGALLGMLNLILMIVKSRNNGKNIGFTILEVSYIIEMSLIIGLYMLTIGSFIGGVWANESWGRYWGWDPKETWALVSVLVYAIILHLRKIPGLKSNFALSSLALVGFGAILMTFFGVNYYLSGMHSYGQGDPPPIPVALYVALVVIAGLIWAASIAEKKTGSIEETEEEV